MLYTEYGTNVYTLHYTLYAYVYCRVGPNRMTVYTPYPRYAVYPVPYMTLSYRFRNRMTVYGFQQAVYFQRIYGHIKFLTSGTTR
jgi:hypothetical protein